MERQFPYIGMDVGSLFFKAVIHGGMKDWPESIYRPHHGNPAEVFRQEVLPLLKERPCRVVVTGSVADTISKRLHVEPVDTFKAIIQAVKSHYPAVRNIIDIGGGSVTLIRLDEQGRFATYSANSLCAAGTGSFLDEQAARLSISYEDASRFTAIASPPTIATRCTVFAKSDLIHRQQEGYSPEEMWAGLCKGMSTTLLQTLLKGSPLRGLTVITGGVAQNQVVMYWLEKMIPEGVVTFPEAHLAAARGALLLAQSGEWPAEIRGERDVLSGWTNVAFRAGDAGTERAPALVLRKTKYPDFSVPREYIDDRGTEVRCHAWPDGGEVEGYLGIDIGSTSTKAVLIGRDGKVILDLYRKTAGEPIEATKKLFAAIEELVAETGTRVKILGVGTTGSGRKLIGALVGADEVVNEITAHVAGAMEVDPTIETIFEIGGQDSKYMRTLNGRIADSNMNYVCAAGTGSFVEEQARKLGFDIREVGDIVEGIAPPITSDRCTVFMEQDMHRLLRQGHSKEEAMAAVMYSVVKNYLNRVVGNRPVSRKRVFFQGATARNKALVAAFENLLDVEVVVSPLCHQMGAYGVALITRENMEKMGRRTRFVGLDLSRRRIELTQEICELCANKCRITFAHIEGVEETPSWGYACGRDPDDTKMKVTRNYDLFRQRRRLLHKNWGPELPEEGPVVGLPMALVMHSYVPFWKAFFATLGYRVKISAGQSSTAIGHKGVEITGADFCYPVKLAHGHVRKLLDEDVDYILVPAMISERNDPKRATNALLCPYVEGQPGYVRTALELAGLPTNKLLTPVVDFRWDPKRAGWELAETMGQVLGLNKQDFTRAWQEGRKAQEAFEEALQETGRKVLQQLEDEDRYALVILGRPYNTSDAGANLDLPNTIAEMGDLVIPVDMIPFSQDMLPEEFRNIYWHYGQKIINAAIQVARNPRLNAVYLTNFSCGPDSFLTTYVEKLMGDKPMLILELDEHGSDGGYQTRIEAFLDVLKQRRHAPGPRRLRLPHTTEEELRGRTLWVPQLHPIGAKLFAAAFRKHGYDAETLPLEDHEAFELGRRVTRGAECLPTAATIGALLKKFKEIGAKPAEHAFFMGTATGPCRFGQYALLHRTVLDHEGYEDVPILAPASYNSYQGLSEPLRRTLWDAIMVGDILFKMRCRTKPYEKRPGVVQALTEEFTERAIRAVERGEDLEALVQEAARAFLAAPVDWTERKPLVGVVGEIYVRCNPFCNQNVVEVIEESGGEAWLAPVSEWFLYTAHTQQWRARRNGLKNLVGQAKSLLLNRFMFRSEKRWMHLAGPVLAERHEPPIQQTIESGAMFVPQHFEGEAILTVGRTVEFAKQGASLVVNCSPFGCMPGTTTTAIFQKLQQDMALPVLNQFYDGTGDLNERIRIFMANLTDARPARPTAPPPSRPEDMERPRIQDR